MTPEQREEIVRLIQQGEKLSPEWARILFPPEKREYELVYHGKEREEDILADTLAVPLQPVRTYGANGADWHNMLIFGDNLQAMKTLLEMKKAGKLCNADGTPGVRLVYIDPPFATKQEFAGTEDQKAYQDRVAGATFIEFLRKRIILIRELLSDDGALYVHLDWRKCHYIKTILDEIFGENHFRNEIIWQRLSARSDSHTYNHIHDVIYFYTKSGTFPFKSQFSKYSEEYVKKFYRYKEVDGRFFSIGDLTARGLRNGESGKPWRGVDPSKLGNHWKVKISTLDQLDAEGKIYWPPKGNVPRLKQYLDESKGRPLQSIWIDISPVQFASGENAKYPTQKPEALLERIIRASTGTADIVLDAFAGAGTTLAVAEKLGRRWIGIDCGKLAVYTIQKRMFNLCKEIGNKGAKLKPKPFNLFNAGLYDFSQLRKLAWEDWRFFALQLFQCRDEPHKVGGIMFDGYRQGADVMVFNHFEHKDAAISEETIQEIHEAVGSRVGNKVFIIAPALTFDFQQDYITHNGVRYYALRIPYSIIHELHRREFTALKQPADEMAVNDTVEAVGFDFIRTPELEYKLGRVEPKAELLGQAFIEIKTFRSDAVVREPFQKKGNRETLSMVMLDFDYDEETQIFDLDDVQYADAIEKSGWKVTFRPDLLGQKMMAVFLDIYGNEARILIDAKDFGKVGKRTPAKDREVPATKKTAAKKVIGKQAVRKGVRK
ncbi:MAG: site-specific DNA-methyltransferase [Desulfatirhabdiaceae bacterium]